MTGDSIAVGPDLALSSWNDLE
ncbi:hypothetical protein RR48_01964 [Papilio machaon]|uniref:Uncharacterized protein n=1 Tax=Papilio machaon TaxID=76193 RepID=A0A0N1PI61_PAPMA|nr:hypothetical protein RR48_01964 [Papilio machaon]